jgi:hypothetical protein
MDAALAGNFTASELRRIKLCRLYFNALTLSDITTATGTCLEPGIQDGTKLCSQSQPIGPRIKQDTPDNRSWGSWCKLLRLFSSLDGTLHTPRKLGTWSVTGLALR